MGLKQLEEIGEFVIAALDGVYGWMCEAIAIVLVVLIFNFFAKWLLKRLHLHFSKQNKIWKDSFVRALYLPLSYYVWFFATIHAIDLISHRVLEKLFFQNMHTILSVALILCLGWFLMRWNNNLTKCLIMKSKNHEIALDQGKIDVINKLITMIVVVAVILFLMEITGRSMNTLIAFGGVGGLAIAFASQEVIANFFGGLMIYLTHPFAIGDWINLPERSIEGHVEEIGWYMTRLRTFEKRPIYIPNSTFSKVVVITPSRMSHRQFKEIVGLRYRDMPQTRAIIQDLKTMLKEHPAIDHSQNILVNLKGFGSYSIDISVSAYTLTINTEGFAEVKQDLLFKIYDILTKHGAEMAFPTTQLEIPERMPTT